MASAGRPSPGAAGLLIIGFDIARDIEMHHEAHVGFIDAHAEGDGGHHHLQIVTLERFLHLRAAIVVQPGVVGADAQPAALQTRSGVFHLGAAVAIDNAALAALILHEAPQLIERLEFFHQRVADVRPVEAADLHQRVLQRQQAHDIAAGGLVGGGGQRDHRHRREALFQLTQRAIFRPEVMAPLRNTVRLIHRQHRRRTVIEQAEEAFHHQPFRRDVQHLDGAVAAAGHNVQLLLAGLRRVVAGGGNAVGQQLVDLVLHQRDQRGNDQRQAVHHQRRDLVTQRLAAAGRHHHQAILPADRGVDNRLLARTELLVAKGIAQYLLGQQLSVNHCCG